MKPTLVEWDEESEDWKEVWTPESEAEFWADELERCEEKLRAPEKSVAFGASTLLDEMSEDRQQQWDGGNAPDGLVGALGNNSLGNATVVADLVGKFVSDIHALCGEVVSGEAAEDDIDAVMREESLKMADIFTGKVAGYQATTWLTAGMGGLKTKARGFVSAHEIHYDVDFDVDGNPVAGLFYSLANEAANAYVAAHSGEGDHSLPKAMQNVIGMLLGYPDKKS
ncbi:hypothetical protein [Thiocapsa rosea]|uniref:Uncharacterized protein n=1 Tax=Thiocapsa rosea TaxID=69360 RepID=A0A495VFZ7_9GAMM|nr:hypothetical protein [Thiocapsa rosea]RKT47503.1 hypothetical protein BDD21_5095 [Thiocapsa rosea]